MRERFLIPLAMMSCVAFARGPMPVEPVERLEIIGRVSPALLPDLIKAHDRLMALPGSGTIDLTIASSGGSVDVMRQYLAVMEKLKTRGYKFRCHAVYAMSAAFMIWLKCNERTTFDKSVFVFHFPYYPVVEHLTAEDALDLWAELLQDEQDFMKQLSVLPFPAETIKQWAKDEKLWRGSELCETTRICTVTN